MTPNSLCMSRACSFSRFLFYQNISTRTRNSKRAIRVNHARNAAAKKNFKRPITHTYLHTSNGHASSSPSHRCRFRHGGRDQPRVGDETPRSPLRGHQAGQRQAPAGGGGDRDVVRREVRRAWEECVQKGLAE